MKNIVNLPVWFIKEDKYFVAYTPALDFAATGESLEEAKQSFSESIQLFLDEIEEKGTVKEVFEGFGWKKLDNSFKPPEVVEQTEEQIQIPQFNY